MHLFKKRISKLFAFVVIFLIATFSVCIPASCLDGEGDSGSGSGGGTDNTYDNYGVPSLTDTAVGYRFSVVDYNGNTKYVSIDVLCLSYSGYSRVSSCYRFTTKRNKVELINKRTDSSTCAAAIYGVSDTNRVYVDSSIGLALPTAIDKVIDYSKTVVNADIICKYLGLGSSSALGNGDKLLVEPLFEVTMNSNKYCVTVSEIGVWGGHNSGYEWTATSYGDGDKGKTWGWIANYTNSNYPSSLYVGHDTYGGGTSGGAFLWYAGSNVWNKSTGKPNKKVCFQDLVTCGYGIGFVYENNNNPIINVDLYSWGVEWYSDANYTNKVASADCTGSTSGCLYEGYTYYPKYWYYNNSGSAMSAYVSAYTYYWNGYYDIVYDSNYHSGGPVYQYNGYDYLWKNFGANSYQTIYGCPFTIDSSIAAEAQRDGGLKYWLSVKTESADIDTSNDDRTFTIPVIYKADLYCWGVEWYSDANYTNKVAESSINTNNAGENLIEGNTYYPRWENSLI